MTCQYDGDAASCPHEYLWPLLERLFGQHAVSRYEFHRTGRIPPLAKSVVAVIFKP